MKRASLTCLLLLLGVFLLGVWHLFDLRFATGDIYPPYSSLRADPLGTKALYESLGRIVSVERNFEDHPSLDRMPQGALLLIGVDREAMEVSSDDASLIEQFVTGGGRLILAFHPFFNPPATLDSSRFLNRTNTVKKTSKPSRSRVKAEKDDDVERPVDLRQRWGFNMRSAPVRMDENGIPETLTVDCVVSGLPFPASLPWHSSGWLDCTSKVWRVIYEQKNHRCVMAERSLGKGSIVMLSDSWLFSNEALASGRQPELLAWMIGRAAPVLFDETHLGVQQKPGVATLIRKYNLGWTLLALAMLGGLFAWKNAVSFLPHHAGTLADTSAPLAGKDSNAGFVNLLKRTLPPARLLAICFEEWNSICGRGVTPEKLRAVEALIAAPGRSGDAAAVEAYQSVCRILNTKKQSQKHPIAYEQPTLK